MDGTFRQILEYVLNVPGYMSIESIAIWDCWLSFQNRSGISGNLLEIGVFRGRSALVMMAHRKMLERICLIDLDHSAIQHALRASDSQCAYIDPLALSSSDPRAKDFIKCRGPLRWIHIDGDHTTHGIRNDLEIAYSALASDGVICVDDFFHPLYPQVTEETYAFARSERLVPLLCGFNKCYLSRPGASSMYNEFISSCLLRMLRERGQAVTLGKTSSFVECPTWGIVRRQGNRDYRGLDSEPDSLPK